MMLKCEILEVQGFESAIHGMRNPKNSWDKSDSATYRGLYEGGREFVIGDNDMKLMKSLFNAGVEHRTYARMINVWMTIEAPLYFWKEMDRYTIGKTQVSCSTMHKIAEKEFTLDDFSHEHLSNEPFSVDDEYVSTYSDVLEDIIKALNSARVRYLETKDKHWWWQMIQLLPSSYNQKRTVMMSYEVIFKIIKERSGHKLDEWHQLIDVLSGLPYVQEIMGNERKENE